jgi:hypothetical protein
MQLCDQWSLIYQRLLSSRWYISKIGDFCQNNPGAISSEASRREACRKDVERVFGMLQAQLAIVRHPALS